MKSGTQDKSAPTGTGPYVLASDAGGSFLTANANWWQGKTLPTESVRLVDRADAVSSTHLDVYKRPVPGGGGDPAGAGGEAVGQGGEQLRAEDAEPGFPMEDDGHRTLLSGG